jgi:hypothetical protein
MAVIVHGFTGATLVDTVKGWTSEAGEYLTYNYKGPVAAIETAYTTAKASGSWDRVEKHIDGGSGSLSCTVTADSLSGGFPADPQPVWEVIGQDLFRDLRSFGGGTAAEIAFNVAADQEALEAIRQGIERADWVGPLMVADPATTYARLLLRGVGEFVRSTAILRSTTIVNARTAAKASWTGVDRAWPIDGGDGSPNPPGTGSSGILGVISDMPDFNDEKKQWLKRAPQVRSIDRGRFQIVQEWWFARRWSYVLYEGDNEADNP